MKKIGLFVFLATSISMVAQQNTPKTAWLEKWDNSKDYLIAIAEPMPEEFYDFKPVEDQMSFKELLIHIKGNMDWLSTTYFSEEDFKRKDSPLPKTKEETIALLKEAFEASYKKIEAAPENELDQEVSFFAGPKSKLQILNLLQDHVTHHRGQLAVYLHLKDIKPPRYVGW